MAIGDAEWLAARKREKEIHCPYCDKVHDDREDPQCVSYWGEESPVEVECLNEHCERLFFVHELVERTYTTSKTGDDDDGD